MSNPACLLFGAKHLTRPEVSGKRILDVGSHLRDMGLRPLLEFWQPAAYIGVDQEAGPGVQRVCDANNLLEIFGPCSFDVVLCMELLEHVADWRRVVSNLKNVCAPDGILLITTRSLGFPYHGFPRDYWRYEEGDIAEIFADMAPEAIEKDPNHGVFAKFRKLPSFREKNTGDISLYSILANRRMREINGTWHRTPRALALRCQDVAKRFLWAVGKRVYRSL